MSRVKQKALSGPPSQEPLEGGSNSAPPFIFNTVAALSRKAGLFPSVTSQAVRFSKANVRPDETTAPACGLQSG